MNFEITYFFYAALGSVLVGLSKGGLPSTGMLAVPILSLSISPIHATTLLLPIYIISDAVGVWLYRKNFSAFNVKILTQGGLLGAFVGCLIATVISEIVVTDRFTQRTISHRKRASNMWPIGSRMTSPFGCMQNPNLFCLCHTPLKLMIFL
jgi:hypothetical protein